MEIDYIVNSFEVAILDTFQVKICKTATTKFNVRQQAGILDIIYFCQSGCTDLGGSLDLLDLSASKSRLS